VSVLPIALLNLNLFTDFYKIDINILSAVDTANIVSFLFLTITMEYIAEEGMFKRENH